MLQYLTLKIIIHILSIIAILIFKIFISRKKQRDRLYKPITLFSESIVNAFVQKCFAPLCYLIVYSFEISRIPGIINVFRM